MDLTTIISFIASNDVIKNKFKNSVVDKVLNAGNDEDKEALGNFANSLINKGKNSIKFKTKQSIATYPVLYSDRISYKCLQKLNSGLEAQYANMLLLVIQNSAKVKADDAVELLSKFHNNIDSSNPTDDTFKLLNIPTSENAFLIGGEKNLFQEACKEINNENYLEDLNMNSLNETSYSDAFRQLLCKSYTIVNEAKSGGKGNNKEPDRNISAKLTNSDIKKANELTPTILTLTVNFAKSKDNSTIPHEITIGVKCNSHLLNSDDIEYYLTKTTFKNSPVVRFIKWTTGEISFFKDFLFCLDSIKRDATKSNSSQGYWWRKLETLSKMATGSLRMGSHNTPIPVATMVISKEDVNAIKYKHGIDLLANPQLCLKIVKNYFLMNFIVVDEGTEIVYMYNETTKDFDRKSLSDFKSSKEQKINIEDLYKMLR